MIGSDYYTGGFCVLLLIFRPHFPVAFQYTHYLDLKESKYGTAAVLEKRGAPLSRLKRQLATASERLQYLLLPSSGSHASGRSRACRFLLPASPRTYGRHAKDPNMTSSVRRGGVIRAALSLQYTDHGEPEAVQLLTSGRRPLLHLLRKSRAVFGE